MALIANPNVVTTGLSVSLDAGNVRSYPGSGTSWTDLSGNGRNGTLTNGPTYDSNNGGSIQFDGSNDFVTLGDVTTLNFTGGRFSVETWARIPSTWTAGSQYPNLISKGATAGWDTNGWSLFVFRNWSGPYAWGCGLRNGATVNTLSRGSVSSDTWLHLVMTLDGSTIRLYENGSLQTSGSQTINPGSTSSAVYLGADVNLQCFPGRIANCRMYGYTLSALEITQNFNASRGRFGV